MLPPFLFLKPDGVKSEPAKSESNQSSQKKFILTLILPTTSTALLILS